MKRREFLQTTGVLLAAHVAVPVLVEAAGKRPAPTVAAARRPLYFTTEAVSRLRRQLAADRSLEAQWAALLARADALLPAELVTEEEARRPALRGVALQGRYRSHSASQLVAMGTTLGLAYRITGDERYAQKLRQALLHYAGYEQWCSPGFTTQTPRRSSDLSTPAFCYGTAAGYDALYDFLSVEDRKQIETAIVRLGIKPLMADWVLPDSSMYALDSGGHNWWSVCVSGAGIGALALLDAEPQARDWVRAADRALVEFFEYRGQVLRNKPINFDPAGGFYEGVGYANYALSEYLIFRLAQSNALPESLPQIPLLDRVAEFFAHTLYPTSSGFLAVNFGDSAISRSAVNTVRQLAIQGFSPELSRWYLQQVDPEPADPLALLYLDDTAPARQALPHSIIYPDIGWAVLRDSWERDATMLAVKSGDTWNHAHADAGSFILYHAGQPLLIDSGACSYGRPEYRGYYTQSRAHNVVLFNGEAQPEEDFNRGAKFAGHLHDLLDGHGLKYLYADSTGPMARYLTRNYRHWLWVDGVILVFDDLRSHEPGRFDWLLHYAGEARRKGGDIELTNGPARAWVRMLHPANPVVSEKEGLEEQKPDRKITYLALSSPIPAREQRFVVAILPQATGGTPVPEVELVRLPEAMGVRVRSSEHVTDVYVNLLADGRQRGSMNSTNTIAGWSTDASLFAVTRSAASNPAGVGEVARYFVADGSYLRRDAQVVLHAFSKVSAVMKPGTAADIRFRGQRHIEATLLALQAPATLHVNGQPTSFDYQPSARTIRFRHRSA